MTKVKKLKIMNTKKKAKYAHFKRCTEGYDSREIALMLKVPGSCNMRGISGKGQKLWTSHNTRSAFGRPSWITEFRKENDVGLRDGQALKQNLSLDEGHSDQIIDVTGCKHQRVINGTVMTFFFMCHVLLPKVEDYIVVTYREQITKDILRNYECWCRTIDQYTRLFLT